MTTEDVGYRDEIDTGEVDGLAADNPNVAVRPEESGQVDHEALMGALVDDGDDPAGDAVAATLQPDEDGDGIPDAQEAGTD